MILLQNVLAHGPRALDQGILAAVVLGERDDFAHARAAQQHGHQAIEAERHAGVRRAACAQDLDQVRELGQARGRQAQDVAQDVRLQRGVVDAATAAPELDAVDD